MGANGKVLLWVGVGSFLVALLLAVKHNGTPNFLAAPPQKVDPPGPLPERFAFKSYKLGMSYQDFAKQSPAISFSGADKRGGARFAFVNTTIGGAKAKLYLSFVEYPAGELLDTLSLTFDKSNWVEARTALISKFGSPSASAIATKRNAFGAQWNGEELKWDNGVSHIKAEEIGDKVDVSTVWFFAKGLGVPTKEASTRRKAISDI